MGVVSSGVWLGLRFKIRDIALEGGRDDKSFDERLSNRSEEDRASMMESSPSAETNASAMGDLESPRFTFTNWSLAIKEPIFLAVDRGSSERSGVSDPRIVKVSLFVADAWVGDSQNMHGHQPYAPVDPLGTDMNASNFSISQNL